MIIIIINIIIINIISIIIFIVIITALRDISYVTVCLYGKV